MIRKTTLVTGMPIIIAASTSGWANTTITVTSLDDPGSPGVCVLRDAITVANNGGGSVNGCSAESGGPYQIGFQPGLSGSIKLRSPLTITGNMTITGPTGALGITIDGGGSWTLISSTTGGTLDLENLTLVNGFSGLSGAGIENIVSTLTVGSCIFSNNVLVQGAGAAIYNLKGTVTVTNSTFTNNNGTPEGGGGIYSIGTLTVVNSTFSGNIGYEGGAIVSDGSLTVTNSTFFDNTSSLTPMVENSGTGTASLHGVILAGSIGGNCAGITDAGYNLSDDDSCDFSGTSQNNVDALLDPAGLADHGGPTQTIALQSGSPALNAIPPADCTYPAGTLNPCSASSSNQLTCDQRGEPRPAFGQANCDIGAYERAVAQGPVATLSATSLSFGAGPVGSVSPQQTVTLTNTGGGSLTGRIAIAGDFKQRNQCMPLSTKQSCTIAVVFTPPRAGILTGTMTVATNAPGNPQTIALSGTGRNR